MVIVFYLFEWEAHKIKTMEMLGHFHVASDHYYPTMIGFIAGCQIKIMSYFFGYAADFLNEWENHEKTSIAEMHLSMKTVIFEFINNYFSLFFIAFIKEALGDKCQNDDCLFELNLQIITILLTEFLFNFVEIGLPFYEDWSNKREYKKNYPEGTEIDFTPHNIHQQLVAKEFSSLRDDYIEILLQFGYLTFFSVAAPLAPFLCFLSVLMEVY